MPSAPLASCGRPYRLARVPACLPLLACLLVVLSSSCAPVQGLRPLKSSLSVERKRHPPHHRALTAQSLVAALPRGGDAPVSKLKQVEHHDHGLSIFSLAINIIADLCPHGMLPLAYGMGAEGGTGVVPAVSLLIIFGSLSAYTLYSIARASDTTRETSFRGIWSRALNPKSAWLIDTGITLLCYGCCIFYAAFIGDLFSALAQAVNAPAFLQKRWVVLVALHTFPLLPLCLMKNLSALQYSSFVGVAGIMYTVFFVVKRCLDRSYHPGGRFHDLIDPVYRPVLKEMCPLKVGPGAISLMNMACVAFTTHYNGISYYEELRGRTLPRYATAVGLGFFVSFLVFLCMMVFGHGTFGASAQALLLNNYHRSADPLATASRVATGFSILCGFPLMFAGLKTGFFSQYRASVEGSESLKPYQSKLLSPLAINIISTVILSSICLVACNCTEEEVGFVIGIIGAILGTGVVYVIPALLNVNLVDRLCGAPRLAEKAFNKFIIGAGAYFSVLGSVTAMEEHHPGFTSELLAKLKLGSATAPAKPRSHAAPVKHAEPAPSVKAADPEPAKKEL